MPELNFEGAMHIAQEHWDSFISLIRQDLIDLRTNQRQMNGMIKRTERLVNIINQSRNDINLLLSHKESILTFDSSLTQKFDILEAFKRRNNLGNDVAVKVFGEILNSESIKNAVEQLSFLKEQKDELDSEIDKVTDLINGTSFDMDIVEKYIRLHGVDPQMQVSLKLYRIFKSSRREVTNIHRRTELPTPIVPTETNELEEVEIPSNDEEVLSTEEETLDYKEVFKTHKASYDELKNESRELLDKYYAVLQGMTPLEIQAYNSYCRISENELKEQDFEGGYDEAMSKIVAMKLFDIKSDLEKMIQAISDDDCSNYDDIDILGEYILEYQKLLDKLKEIDKRLDDAKKEGDVLEGSKVFFLTNEEMQPFIPETIYGKSYRSSLLSIINKGEEGLIQSKKGCNVKALKPEDLFKDICGRTVFMLTNNKIVVSYVKLNSGTGLNDGGIMIITACLKKPNTIKEDTEKIVKENKEKIISQIEAFEKADIEQLGMQSIIMDSIKQEAEALETEAIGAEVKDDEPAATEAISEEVEPDGSKHQ